MEHPLANENDLQEDGTKEVDFFGRPVILVKKNGKVYAYVNCCAHVGGPMELKGDKIECKWHDSHFDLETGKALKEPAPLDSRLISLPIVVKEGKIFYKYP